LTLESTGSIVTAKLKLTGTLLLVIGIARFNSLLLS
jgi:hypothetical protein